MELGLNSVVYSDRQYLRIPFAELSGMLDILPTDLEILALTWHGVDETKLRLLEPSGVPNVLKNFQLSSWSFYLTPKGAQRILNIWIQHPHILGESVLMYNDDFSKVYACDPCVTLSPHRIFNKENMQNAPNEFKPIFRRDH